MTATGRTVLNEKIDPGKFTIMPLFDAQAPGRTGGALVTFQPGARTAWHTHPLGQNMSHIAIHESLNGSPVEWMEKVSDKQYRKNTFESKGE